MAGPITKAYPSLESHRMVNIWLLPYRNMAEANSAEGESYHSWSHNNRWLVFSSRRLDGLYTRPFFTYIDDKGTAHKPFLLPQKNPVKYYKDLLWTYNLPEFIQEKAQVDTHAVMETMRNTKGIQVK